MSRTMTAITSAAMAMVRVFMGSLHILPRPLWPAPAVWQRNAAGRLTPLRPETGSAAQRRVRRR